MNHVNFSAEDWMSLAREQLVAAEHGGRVWIEFMFVAEQRTQLPWQVIREKLDPFVEAILTESAS